MQTFEKITVKPLLVGEALDTTLKKRTLILKNFYKLFKSYIEGMPLDNKEIMEKSLEKSEKIYRINTKRLKHLENLYIKIS